MADENIIQTNIVANSNMSGLIGDLNRVSLALSKLQQQLLASNKGITTQISAMNRTFAETLRSTGQFSTHFVSLTSDVDKFGQQLDKGQLKLGQFFRVYGQHAKTQGGLIRDLAKQQVQLQGSILQPLGKNAEGIMQYNVHIPRGLDTVKNKTAIARQELAIMNKVVQEGAGQLINWGKNTQWAGRQLTVGLTIPIAAFGKASADAFKQADEQLVRLTKVYGGLSATSSTELAKVRRDVQQTASELAKGYGASFTETLGLAGDIAATGKQGSELLGSIQETTRLAVLGEVDRQEAMKATLAIQTAFKQNTSELAESINFLNAVENQTSTTLQDLVEAIPKAGPIIKGLGGSVQDLALYLTAMREGGVSAAEGANALKSALGAIINPTKVATAMFADFGINLRDIVSKNAGNVTGTILEIQSALDQLDPLQKQQALEQLFGKFQFARMNALFSNLGKQGSQTLQVLDLMKASSQDLANIAARELTQVTESASGRYRRALEGLKADLAGVGEQFLNISTVLLNIIDKVITFTNKLPGPVKQILGFLGLLTATSGPLIMLTGVLGNFFGYIIKGIYHFKSFFKGAEGWKLLTPEILAANRAGDMAEETFYSDAKAAAVLKQALDGLTLSYARLEEKINQGVISTNPAAAAQAMMGVREVNPQHPLLSPKDTRSMSHLNPVSKMTTEQRAAQTLFGVVPGAPKVNQKIGGAPQIYQGSDLPPIAGLTRVNGVSTGVVAEEAAKWHAMTGALAMQSKAEISKLKAEVASTGLITDELSASYQALLPQMTKLTTNAAEESALIVKQLQAGKINVDQARAKIVALNAQIEAAMGVATNQIAQDLGRTVDITKVPLLNQPVVDPRTGKSNMKELLKPGRTRGVFNKIAQALGVKTYGAPYSIETTRPRRMNTGGYVYTLNEGNIVPGPNINADVVPAMLTPGEFVVNAEATRKNLPLLQAINGAGSNGPGYNLGSNSAIRSTQYEEVDIGRTSNITRDQMQQLIPGFRGKKSGYRVKGTAGVYVGDILDPALVKKYPALALNGVITRQSINKALEEGGVNYEVLLAGIKANKAPYRTSTDQFIDGLIKSGQIGEKEGRMLAHQAFQQYELRLKRDFHITDKNNPLYESSTAVLKRSLTPELSGMWKDYSSAASHHTNMGRRSTTALSVKLKAPDGSMVDFGKLKGTAATGSFLHAKTPGPLLQRLAALGITKKAMKAVPFRFSRNIVGRNRGGIIPGYKRGTPKPIGENAQDVQASSPYAGSFMAGLGMQMAGGAIGGTAGNMLMLGGAAMQMSQFIAPMLKSMKSISTFGGMLKGIAALGPKIGMALRAAFAFATGPIGITIGLVTGLGIALLKVRKHFEDTGKANRLAFGGTSSSYASVGIKNYKSLSDRLKDYNQQLDLNKAKIQSTFESFTKGGPTGITLSIKELNDAISNAKKNQKEYVEGFNNIDASKVNAYASSLKAQFVAMGLSASEAANNIYSIIKASDKASMAVGAVSTTQFRNIVDSTSALKELVNNLATNLGNSFNPEEFVLGIDSLVNGAISYSNSLTTVKDKNSEFISQNEAIAKTVADIGKLEGANSKLNSDQLLQIKKLNIAYANILGTAESLQSVTAKILLYQNGLGEVVNLAAMGAERAVEFAQNMSIVKDSMSEIFADQSLKNNPLGGLAEILKSAKDEAANAAKKVSNLNKFDKKVYEEKIKQQQQLIKSIEKEREARLKLLDIQERSANFETDVKSAQIRYQEALAAGDMAQAAQEQLNIKQLTSDRQRELARSAINDKYDRERERAEAEIERLQAIIDAAANATVTGKTRQEVATGRVETIEGFKKSIEDIVLKYITEPGKPMKPITSEDTKSLANIINAMKTSTDAKIKSEGMAMEKKYLSYQPVEFGGSRNVSFNSPQFIQDANSLLFQNGTKDFKSAVSDFAQAVRDFAGIPNGAAGGQAFRMPIQGESKNVKFGKDSSWMLFENSKGSKIAIYGKSTTFKDIYADASSRGWMFTGYSQEGIGFNGEFASAPKNYKEINRTKIPKAATGGRLVGPGTGTSDSMLAMVSTGEYIINAKSAQNIGYPMLDNLNKYALGGMVKYDIPKMNMGGIVDARQNSAYGDTITMGNIIFNMNELPSDARKFGTEFIAGIKSGDRNRVYRT